MKWKKIQKPEAENSRQNREVYSPSEILQAAEKKCFENHSDGKKKLFWIFSFH